MNTTTLEYQIPGTLKNGLAVATEIENEMGMTPAYITDANGIEMKYDPADALKVQSGEITEQIYADLHTNK